MWLDRLSGHSTPSASPPPHHHRNISPNPRQVSRLAAANQINRPFSPRSSSLSLSLTANTSTVSLRSRSRSPTGLSLKQGASRPLPHGTTEPVDVVHDLIGKPRGSVAEGYSSIPSGADAVSLGESIDFGGLSLKDYVAKTAPSKQEEEATIGAIQVTTVARYESERNKFEDLHNAISGCDDVLKSIETYFTSFQNELGAVSAEIETLQSRSISLNSKLENRRKVEKLLGPAVENVSISPMVVKTIAEGPVDDVWVKALHEVETKATLLEDKSTNGLNKIKAMEDVKPLLQDLQDKAIERIRDFLVAQIKSFRSPNINAQIIQQQSLVRFKDLYAYLSRHHTVLAGEITQAYINTMRWYYLHHFTRYHDALTKVKMHTVDKFDTIGTDPSTRPVPKQAAPSTTSGGSVAPTDAFNLGKRADVLKTNSTAALSTYLIDEDKTQHHLEYPFRNFNLALIDNVSAEFSFVTSFFRNPSFSFHAVSKTVTEIFNPIFTLGHTMTKTLITESCDAIGILLCVRLNQHFAFELQRRKVPVADTYINGTNILLWPRFQQIMDLHVDSLRKLSSNISGGVLKGNSALTLNLSLSSSSSNNTNTNASTPHPITQRYALFLSSLLTLSSISTSTITVSSDSEPLSASLTRLRSEYESVLSKLSKSVGGADAKKRERFLTANWSLVAAVLGDEGGEEGLLGREMRKFYAGCIKGVGKAR